MPRWNAKPAFAGWENVNMLNDTHIRKLASINSIEALLMFLREDLHWPLGDRDVEDVTFGYEAHELGLKAEHAPKVNKIYLVRPITRDQPWGIFYIDFENKKLPVTLMRRILNSLVIKQRGPTATGSAWEAGDLLFMTTYGEEEEGMREVAFAHFHESPGDLPTLNVVLWDAQDTAAKLQDTYQKLKTNLGWPPDTGDKHAWREQWRKPFKHRIGHIIRTSKALAEKLAELSRDIHDRVKEVLDAETENGPMTRLYKAFQSALIHDLNPADFADTFAQTITYGLFSAAISRTPEPGSGQRTHFLAEDVAAMVPVTNPFLREVLETFLDVGGRRKGGIDFDELGVQEVVELLRGDETDLPAILRDFGNRRAGEDPVIHFYEDYLKAYSKKLKVQRGVFYTPQPVVSYIVRSVHELLQTEFGIEDGLASTITWGEMHARNPEIAIPAGAPSDSPFVVILDPATGTATFLVEVIDVIWKHLRKKWESDQAGAAALLRTAIPPRTFDEFWNSYVPDHLLPRLYGYELMMAPYAIAHMKVGLKLTETGYRFGSEKRVRIYLTNALEPASELQARLALDWEALAHEAMAVKAVKETQRFTVVIGNPPYSINSCNLDEHAVALVEPFRHADGERIRERGALKFETILQDDYIKFWGLALRCTASVPWSVIGMITNNGFLTNRVLRGMRNQLLGRFRVHRYFNLHGNRSKSERCPDGSLDDNVFDIDQGVSISIIRTAGQSENRSVYYGDLFGAEAHKLRTLLSTSVSQTAFLAVNPRSPYYMFSISDADVEDEYREFVPLDEAMPFNKAGFVSGRDEVVVDFEAGPLLDRMAFFLDPANSDASVRARFAIKDAGGYTLASRRRAALASNLRATDIIAPVQHRPFDYRSVAYSEAVLTSPQKAAMRHLLDGSNIAFCLSRGAEIQRGWEHIFCTRALMQHHTLSLKEVNYVFPVSLIENEGALSIGAVKRANFSPHVVSAIIQKWTALNGSSQIDSEGVLPFLGSYIYCVLHSPDYRTRYSEFLKTDFPRIPLPGSGDLFQILAKLGSELVALHLMESPALDQHLTTFLGPAEPVVEKVSWSDETVWIDRKQTVGFRGVREEVWKLHIGGYQVCEKWLKDRGPKGGKPGRTLTPEDIEHYHRIVVALSETIRIMGEIDVVIEQHGGWPGAFTARGG